MQSIFTAVKWRELEGFAFGFHQNVIHGQLTLPARFTCNTALLQSGLQQVLGQLETVRDLASSAQATLEFLLAYTERLQALSGVAVLEHGRVLNTTEGEYQLVVPCYQVPSVLSCLDWVFQYADRVLAIRNTAELPALVNRARTNLEHLRKMLQPHAETGVNTRRFLRAAIRSQTPFLRLSRGVYSVGQGHHSRWLSSSYTDRSGQIAAQLTTQKHATSNILRKHGIPVARHYFASSADEAVAHAKILGYPVVVKPNDLDRGIGVHAGLVTEQQVRECFREASQHSKSILVEEHIEGRDFRLTVFEGEIIKAIERIPGGVTGDGEHTVRQLVDIAAQNPITLKRSRDRGRTLLQLDKEAMALLQEAGLNPDSIPSVDRFIALRRRANVSTGGTTQLVADIAHRDNLELAIRTAEVMRLDVAGIDLIIPDITRSWRDSRAIICEVNSQPQIGDADISDIYERFLQKLLQGDGRIPTALLICPPSLSPLETLDACSTALRDLGPGTILASNAALTLDGQPLSDAPGSFVACGQAGLLCRQAQRLIMAASLKEILDEGLPCQRLDWLLVIGEEPSDRELIDPDRIIQSLVPQLNGGLVCSPKNPLAKSIAGQLDNNYQVIESSGDIEHITLVLRHLFNSL